jgi:AraC-like DNA-binding protein
MIHLQGYTLISFFEYLAIPKNKLSVPLQKYHKWAGWLIGFYLFIGLSQWIRFSFAEYQNLNLIIPMTASIHLYLVVMIRFNRSFSWKGLGKKDRKLADFTSFSGLPSTPALEQITKDKLYLQEGLTISKLAFQLGIPPHELSSLLNTTTPGGFALYINSLRVDYAKRLLVDPHYDHLSMEGIGRESGFQSRSAFYQYFKQACGMSPSLYQKKMSGIPKPGQADAD